MVRQRVAPTRPIAFRSMGRRYPSRGTPTEGSYGQGLAPATSGGSPVVAGDGIEPAFRAWEAPGSDCRRTYAHDDSRSAGTSGVQRTSPNSASRGMTASYAADPPWGV